jgi:hypothetical protein
MSGQPMKTVPEELENHQGEMFFKMKIEKKLKTALMS